MNTQEPHQGPRLGRYVLERKIASGGMAEVYLARQEGAFGFAKKVALKVLKADVAGDHDHVRMFLREALVAAEFRHPNLAQMYEVGEDNGRLFLAMELIRGISVSTLMVLLAQKKRSIPIPLAVRIARDALEGLGYAHEARGADGQPLCLVHRDVTPQNLMIDADGVVKVVDFGIARAETALGRTQAPKIKGKFSYMAPEQWEPGLALDARADLFGLAVVLYEMSTGSGRLFKAATPVEAYRAVTTGTIPPPSTRVPDYPEDLARVVLRGLERARDARWATARDMAQALTRVLEAHAWQVETRTLAQLVALALDGQPVEARWERIAAEGLSPAEDVATLVDHAPPGAMTEEPDGFSSPRVRLALGGAALGGWLLTGAALGLYLRERARADTLTAQVLSQASRPAATAPPEALPAAAGLIVLADPSMAQNVAGAWGALVEQSNPAVRVRVEAGLALDRMLLGAAGVAVVPGFAAPQEVARARAQGFELRAAASEHVAGWDNAVLVVHRTNPLGALTVAQVAALFTSAPRAFPGRGPAGAPRRVLCGLGNPSRALADALVFTGAAPDPGVEIAADEGSAVRAVAQDPLAVALVRLAWVNDTVRVVPLQRGSHDDPVAPSREAVRAGAYPLVRPVVLYTRGAPWGPWQDLVRAATSAEGQSLLERAGYLSR
ncbi:MAG: protein kinase [Deltaproteobacteria bacterium]|nr:protein kinase [Deltaproteobacteria bacterium]